MRYGYRRREGGFVLLIVLVAVLLVVGISALAIRQSLNDARLSLPQVKRMSCLWRQMRHWRW